MSLVWTIIAGFLYFEIFLVLLFVLPIATPQKWNRLFKSRFLAFVRYQAQIYFYLLFGVLIIFLLEAIREMRKYSTSDPAMEAHLNVGMQHSMRLFRAQRNFYISGFAIFLTLVIRRLVILISIQAQLLAQAEASMRQAQSATMTARSLLTQQKNNETTLATEVKADDDADKDDDADDDKKRKNSESTNKLIAELKEKITELTDELAKVRKDKEAIKSQAESVYREYDRVSEEYSKLQKQITISSAGVTTKKDD